MTQEKVYGGVPLYKMTRMEVIEVLLGVEGQRDKLFALVNGRVGIIEPITDCDCLDCLTLRAAREIMQ